MAAQDRLEILRLVQEQKLTVEEAERRLVALEERTPRAAEEPRKPLEAEGAAAHPTSSLPHGNQPVVHPAMAPGGFWGRMLGATGLEDLRSLGQFFREELMRGVWGPLEDWEPGQGEGDTLHPVGNRVVVPPGTELVLWQRAGENLKVHAGEGDALELLRGRFERVVSVDTRLVVWLGEATVAVPASVHSVKLFTAGGDVLVRQLGCALHVRSMGGDVRVLGVRDPLVVQALGGEVAVGLEADHATVCRVSSKGGEVNVGLPRGYRGQARVVAAGGEVEVDARLRGMVRREGRRVTRVDMGVAPEGPPSDSQLELESLGGGVHLLAGEP